ncbi:WecB/TagA/CpsF family glycosyltransferase [Bacillus kwashiorkori]|uniref:WecB/TagA/CpsF family glycosyltransferase n=1 Tax=Bacillus kwashiorkori TaxID=1522318 RepID=UPI0007821900|nr:WecB/TagA/CpsF family glycosyltransferase [Bacillus kwashiorkori]
MVKVNYGGIYTTKSTSEKVLQELQSKFINKEKTRVFYINAHCYNVAQKDKTYKKYLNEAEYVLNDGLGIDLGGKILNVSFDENLNGTDFTPLLLKLAEENNQRVFLLGGYPGVAETAANNFLKVMPKLQIVGVRDGYFQNTDEVIDEINAVKPDLLIVALGVPLQEKWVTENFERLNATVMTGVGAFLDFASNRIPRAPEFIRKVRLEWVYRLLREPKRLWKRTFIGNFTFFYYIMKYRWKQK